MTASNEATVVRESPDWSRAEGWSFVLEAVGVPHDVVAMDGRWLVCVPPAMAARALGVLAAHDRDVREEAAARESAPPDVGPSLAGVGTAVALLLFFLLTGGRGGGDLGGWFRAGSAVAERIVAGEWWRAITALTLHADVMHVAGNGVACVVFVAALGRWLRSGPALLLTVLAGAGGNLLTAWAYGSHHDSVGASTATFGALGLLGGLQAMRWRRGPRLGKRRALTAIAAALGVFAMLGVGERTDVLAHLFGLLVGIALGLVTGKVRARPVSPAAGWAALALALGLVTGAWALALARI